MTKLLVESEFKNNYLNSEKESVQNENNELKDERNKLNESVEKINKELKNFQDKMTKENINVKNKLLKSEEKCVKLEEIRTKSNAEFNVLMNKLDLDDEKIKSHESKFMNLNNQYSDLELKYNSLKNECEVT